MRSYAELRIPHPASRIPQGAGCGLRVAGNCPSRLPYTTIQYHNHLLIDGNSADDYAVIYLSQSEFRGNDSGHLTFSNNVGSILMFNSNITFSGFAKFVNNQPSKITTDDFKSGGALALFQSNVFFDGVCYFEHNHAGNGGAIHSTESKFYVNGNVRNYSTQHSHWKWRRCLPLN